MSILDWFRPKWRHSDREVRLQTIRQLTDQATLFRVVLKEPCGYARAQAYQLLHDQNAIARVATTAKSCFNREDAAKHLTDRAVLASIVRKDQDPRVRRAAALRIDDQGLLGSIADNDPDSDVREAAVSRLEDQTVLARAALKDRELAVRMAALAHLADHGVLANLAENDAEPQIREAAIERLDDQDALAKIARNAKEFRERKAAIKRLTDQDVLVDLAVRGTNHKMREAAVARLTDQVVLAELAKNDPDQGVRRKAIESLTSETVLSQVAREEKDSDLRTAADDRLNALILLAWEERGARLKHMTDSDQILGVMSDALLREERDALAGFKFRDELHSRKTGVLLAGLQALLRTCNDNAGPVLAQCMLHENRSVVVDAAKVAAKHGLRSMRDSIEDAIARIEPESTVWQYTNPNIPQMLREQLAKLPADYARNVACDPNALLQAALAARDWFSCRKAIGDGANVATTTDDEGRTPLHIAAGAGALELVDLLIRKGADLNARDSSGSTPLLKSVFSNAAVTTRLLEAGADVNASDKDGCTALMVSAMGGDLARMELLIRHGAEVNRTDKKGRTALDMTEYRLAGIEQMRLRNEHGMTFGRSRSH
jgi:hypothetical protein